MNKRILLFFIGICCLYNLQAQDTSKYDLKRCITYALENSYLNQSTELEAAELFSEYKAKKSKILPQIDFYLGYHNYFNDLPTYIFPSSEGSILSGGSSTGPYPVELGLPHNLNTGIDIADGMKDLEKKRRSKRWTSPSWWKGIWNSPE